jgi:hypothetical protein
MPRKSASIGEEFLELRHRLAEWRKDHSPRTPLPDNVWKVAVELARVMRKFKRFKHHTVQASQFLQKLAKERVDLFVHWRIAVAGTFA